MGTIRYFNPLTGLGLIMFIICAGIFSAFGQTPQYMLPAFTLAREATNDVELYKMNSYTNNWQVVGNTGKSRIKAIAINSSNETIFAVDGGTLGKLNPLTAQFTVIGDIGTGNGEDGLIEMNSIYGLTYDANRNILYAIHRVDPWDTDVLLKINPATGAILKNSMRNAAGNLVDYKTIEITTFFFGSLYTSKKFGDLAYDNLNDILYLTHNYYSYSHGINGYSNIDGQNPVSEFLMSPIEKLSGLAFDNEEKIYGVFTDNNVSTGREVSGPGGGVVNYFGVLNEIDSSKGAETIFFGMDFYKTDYCKNHLVINNPVIADCPKIAKQTINSNTVISTEVEFIANNQISLNNYFEAKPYSNFSASIKNLCN